MGKKFEYAFEMAGNTTTLVIARQSFEYGNVEILLGKRSDDSDAFPGYWSHIGGFLTTGKENLPECAVREAEEESKLIIPTKDLQLIMIDDDPYNNTDPRYTQVINAVYGLLVTNDTEYNIPNMEAGDDLQELQWFPRHEAVKMELAFKHNMLLLETCKVLSRTTRGFNPIKG